MTPSNEFDTFIAYLMTTLPELDESITDVQQVGTDIVVVRGDTSLPIAIEPFERAYRRRPDAIDAVVSTLLRVSKGEQGVPDLGYQTIAELIVPQLKPIALLVDMVDRGAEPIIYRLFLADLILTYAIRDRGRLSYLTETQIERWGVSEQTVHEQAMRNLTAKSQDIPYHLAGKGSQQVVIFNVNDGLDAARLLLPDLIQQAARNIPGNLVIGIPNRDFMVVFSDDDPDRVTAVSLQITQDMRQHAHGLTTSLFTITDGEIRDYKGM